MSKQNDWDRHIADLNFELASLREESDKWKLDHALLCDDYKAIADSNEKLRERLAIKDDAMTAQTLVIEAYEKEVKRLTEENKALTDDYDDMTERITAVLTTINRLKEDNANIHYELVNRIAELSEVKAKLSRYENAEEVEL